MSFGTRHLAAAATAAVACVALIAATATGAAGPGRPSGVHIEDHVIEVPRADPVNLRLIAGPHHGGHGARYVEAVREHLQRLHAWLGPFPHRSLTVVDAPPRHAPLADHRLAGPGVAIHTRWLEPVRARTIEGDIAGALAAHYWRSALDASRLDGSGLAAALEVYTQARLLDAAYGASRAYERRFFGDVVPYVIRSVPVYAFDPGFGSGETFAGVSLPAPARRQALALVTLERYLGWPVLQRALHLFVDRWRSRQPRAEDFFAAVSEAAGRDLDWFVNDAFLSDRAYDYGVEMLASEPHPEAPRRFVTTVVVRRYGDATFTGTSREPLGPFEAGRGVEMLVSFADGGQVRDHWDGRASSWQLAYEGGARASYALVDPDRVLALDVNRLNDVRAHDPPASPAIRRWTVAWIGWLQNAMLTYGPLL